MAQRELLVSVFELLELSSELLVRAHLLLRLLLRMQPSIAHLKFAKRPVKAASAHPWRRVHSRPNSLPMNRTQWRPHRNGGVHCEGAGTDPVHRRGDRIGAACMGLTTVRCANMGKSTPATARMFMHSWTCVSWVSSISRSSRSSVSMRCRPSVASRSWCSVFCSASVVTRSVSSSWNTYDIDSFATLHSLHVKSPDPDTIAEPAAAGHATPCHATPRMLRAAQGRESKATAGTGRVVCAAAD